MAVGQGQINPGQTTVVQQAAPVPQTYTAVQNPSVTPQTVQVPNYSGVNIQIFNPTVSPPGASAPVYNVNSPNYTTNPVSGSYPSNYYTNNYGQTNPAGANASASATASSDSNGKKTEKREIVELTDDYIKNLENYLNSQDKDVRMMGAKEVVARLREDKSRKNDRALNALINKMLQDPAQSIRVLALAALDSRIVTGDDYTVKVLKNMQNSTAGYGQDAAQATEILLKMSGKTVEKEFEVKDKPQKVEKKQV